MEISQKKSVEGGRFMWAAPIESPTGALRGGDSRDAHV